MEVNFRTRKKIAQSNHKIVPLDGRIAPEGCFDPLETFKSCRWPWQLWMIAKRCKLSCSKSRVVVEREFDLFVGNLKLSSRHSAVTSAIFSHCWSTTCLQWHSSIIKLSAICNFWKDFSFALVRAGSLSIDIDLSTDCKKRNGMVHLLYKHEEAILLWGWLLARANFHLEKLATLQPNRLLWLWTFFKKFSRGWRRDWDGDGGGWRGR